MANILFASVFVFWASGCSESTGGYSGESHRYGLVRATVEDPDGFLRTLPPNDSLPGDSVRNHLGSGVVIWTQPGGDYFLEVPSEEAEMDLNRFEYREDGAVRTSPQITEGLCDGKRCRFLFSGDSDLKFWFAALSVDGGKRGIDPPAAVRFLGEGNSKPVLPLTLVFIGKLPGLRTDSAREEFAERLASGIGGLYEGSGVSVELRGWRTGSNHPVRAYAAELRDDAQFFFDIENWEFLREDGFWMHGDRLSEGWSSEKGEALEILVVDAITEVGVVGVSPLPGFTMGGGYGSTAVVGARAFSSSNSLVPNEIPQIAATLGHELGHFLGLRHTTPTWSDRETLRDWSLHDDGIPDTPYDPLCGAGIASASAYVSGTSRGSSPRSLPIVWEKRIRPDLVASGSVSHCPDSSNLMFPYVMEEVEKPAISAGQSGIMKANLRLMPH